VPGRERYNRMPTDIENQVSAGFALCGVARREKLDSIGESYSLMLTGPNVFLAVAGVPVT
jgi:hypothetical protein